jgi:hypothetical protein
VCGHIYFRLSDRDTGERRGLRQQRVLVTLLDSVSTACVVSALEWLVSSPEKESRVASVPLGALGIQYLPGGPLVGQEGWAGLGYEQWERHRVAPNSYLKDLATCANSLWKRCLQAPRGRFGSRSLPRP